jgi:hypothetical protein
VSLSSIYTELHRNAARTGQDRAMELKGGARLAVRVKAGIVTITISRKGKKVGDTELVTFKRDCNVPSAAVRIPAEDQHTRTIEGVVWHSVSFCWREDGTT